MEKLRVVGRPGATRRMNLSQKRVSFKLVVLQVGGGETGLVGKAEAIDETFAELLDSVTAGGMLRWSSERLN